MIGRLPGESSPSPAGAVSPTRAGKSRVENRRGEVERAEKSQRRLHGGEHRHGRERLEQRRESGEKAAGRVTAVEQHVVPGEDARSIRVRRGCREHRLLENRYCAPVAAMHVEHADEGGRHDDGERVGGEEQGAAQDRQLR